MTDIGLFSIKDSQKKTAVKYIIDSSSPTRAFFFILTLSVIIVTYGLLMNNPSVVIGGMLVSPMLSPIISVALGFVLGDFKLLYRSMYVVGKTALFSVGIAFLIATFFINKEINPEITSRFVVDFNFFFVAVASGIAASYAIIKEEAAERVIGVAIAVALLPPISVTGIGIAFWDWSVINGSLMLFIVNLAGVILGSLLIFSLFRLYPTKQIAEKELAQEEKILEQEKKISELELAIEDDKKNGKKKS